MEDTLMIKAVLFFLCCSYGAYCSTSKIGAVLGLRLLIVIGPWGFDRLT